MNFDNLHLEPFPRQMVEAVETLIQYARKTGTGNRIDSEADWALLGKVIHLWSIFCPADYKQFAESQQLLWKTQINSTGSVRQGDAVLRHTMQMSQVLDALIKVFFPHQKMQDRKFQIKFIKMFPLFRAAEKYD